MENVKSLLVPPLTLKNQNKDQKKHKMEKMNKEIQIIKTQEEDLDLKVDLNQVKMIFQVKIILQVKMKPIQITKLLTHQIINKIIMEMEMKKKMKKKKRISLKKPNIPLLINVLMLILSQSKLLPPI